MAWSLDEIRIFVQEESDVYNQAIARLQPLASGTVYHIFGWESAIRRISGKIVGFTDRTSILAMNRDGETHSLTGGPVDDWDWGDFYVHSVQTRLEPAVWQTFDLTKECDEPVFTIDIELFKLE
jgi:hypothetical protein